MSDQSDIKVSIVGDSTNVEETFAKVERGAEKMAQSTVRSGEKASKSTEGIGKGADGAARAYGRFEAEIRRKTAAVQAALEGTGRAGEIANKAIAQGLDVSKLEPGLKTLRELELALGTGGKQLDQYGLSAKQTAAALRGVPAQMTDIIVSLQGGQAPMTVLLQQGGQLKDMFGGIVPAAKALSGAALGLVNPFTVAAGAAAGLYMAYRAGASEAEAFEKTLVMTGNRAGLTASQLAVMAQSMDAVYGTQRNASQALNQFAGAAGIASKNFQEFALAAIKWEDATGTAVSETVKQFEALGKAPVEASLKLNESMNYLTASVYEQIKALEQSGKATEAAELAQRAFADSMDDRGPKIVEQVGLIEQAWQGVKKAISEAIDSMAAIGRNTLADQIAFLDQQIRLVEERNKFSPYTLSDPAAAIKQQRATLQARMELENSAAELGKFISDSNRASIEASRFRDEYIADSSRQTQSQRRIAEIEKEEAKFKKAIANLSTDSEKYKEVYAAHKTALLNIDKQFEEKKKSGGIKATDTELARLRASIQAEELRAQALLASGSAYASLNEYEVKAIEYGEKLKLTTDAKTKAKLQELKAESERAGAAKRANDELDRQLKSQAQTTDSVRKQNQSLKDQIETYGLGKSAIEEMIIARLEERLAIEESKPGNDAVVAGIREEIAARRELMGNMRTKEALDLQLKEWEQWEKDVGQIFQQVSQSLTDAIFEGGKSGRDLVKDLFKTLTLRVLINPVMNAIQGQVTQSLGSAFGYSNPAVSGASKSKSAGMPDMDFNQFMGGSIGNNLSSFGSTIGSTMVTEFGAGLTAGAGGALSDAGATALMNIGTEGSKSFAAGSGLGGAGLGSALGYAGAIYSLTQGKYGSAVGTAIGTAILPGVGTAIGGLVGGIADSLFGDEEPKTRHGQWEWADMTGGDWGLKYRDDRQPAGTGDAIVNYARSAVDSANDLLGKLGVNAAIEHFFATTNSSRTGEFNGVASGGSIRAGDSVSTFGLMGLGGDRTKYGYGGWSKEEMLPRLQTDIQLSILEAFQTQVDSLPGLLADMIRGVNIRGLDAAGAQALAEQFNAVIQGVDQFRTAVESLPFENLKNLSFDAAANLIQFAGGLDSLNAGLSTYYENFYSEAEQQQKVWADIGKVLDGVGLTVPKTRESFRALVEAQDLTTEAGQRAYAALLGVSGAFAQVATASEQAAQETARAAQAQAQAQRDILIGNLESAYSAVVSAGQAEITRLQQSFGVTDSALEAYRAKVQALESQFGAMFSSIDGYIKELRGNVEASAMAQYREARALISTALVTGQLPDAGRLSDALQVAQRGVTGQVYASRFEQEKAYTILANEMQALKDLASPELDTAKATLAQLEEQYALLRGTNRIAGDSLSALEQQVRLALSTEEAARSQISLIEQQLEEAKQQYEALLGIDSSIKDLATAMREFAAAAVAMAKPSAPAAGGGTGGWTPGSLPAGAESLSAAERYVLYNNDLLQDQASSGMSVDQYAQYHWNTYGQYEDRDIKYRAMGGYTPPGLTWVGEEGPELVNFKQPAMVYTAAQSANLMGGVGGDRETKELLRQIVQRLDRLEAAGRATAVNTSRMDQKLEDAMQGGDAIRTKEVAIA